MSSVIHISLNAETLFHIGSLPVSNAMLSSTLISLVLLIFALIVRLNLNQNTIKPSGIQNLAELIVETLLNFFNTVTGDLKKSRLFLPPLATFFIFIILNNWMGLLPGIGSIGVQQPATEIIHQTAEESLPPATESEQELVQQHTGVINNVEPIQESAVTIPEEKKTKFVPIFRPGTADLNTTIALALISVFLIQFFGIKFLKLSYFKKFVNFSSPVNFYVGVLETISEFSKIISFSFRLFGNIFAGEVLLVVMTYLTKVMMPVPFYGLEVFVGFIQALVFTMLSLVFYNMATAKAH